MGTEVIIGIVAVIAVIGLVAFFVLKNKDEEAELPAETPKKKPAAAKPKKSHAAAKKAKVTKAKKAAKEEEEKEEPVERDADEAEQPKEAAPARAAKSDEEAAAEIKALRKGLASTRGGFIARLAKLFGTKKTIDPEMLDEIQEVLLTADLGVGTAEKILERLKARMDKDELQDEDKVWEALRDEAGEILAKPLGKPGGSLDLSQTPSLILVVGVNGVGKTTTIGKLASRYTDVGQKVILAAGDTFRAAAVLQLQVWGRKTKCEVVHGKPKADPASVIFDAINKAKEDGADLVIADTAGRLHTKSNLMEELKKVVRSAEKALGRPVDEILLVLDSTTGQNAIQQAQLFKDAIAVSGIALTKLDGTAKGGVILGIVDQHELPVHFVGIGERVEDLREFDSGTFVKALFAKPDDETLAA